MVTDRASPNGSYDPAFFSQLFHVEDRHFWFRARNQVLAAVVTGLTAEMPTDYRVLEIGCGTGNVLRVLERACAGGSTVGVDLFAEGLLYASQRTNALLVQADMYALPFGVPFDLIGLFDVLEHLQDDRQVLRSLRGILAEDGRLLLTVPAYPRLWSYFDEASHHRRRYSRSDLIRNLVAAGYVVERISYSMASILPLLWLGRNLARMMVRGAAEDSANRGLARRELRVTPVVNELLMFPLWLEAQILARGVSLPFGSSLVAVARRA